MKEPQLLVKTFVHEGKCYMYDAQKNMILGLSSEAYTEVNKYIDNLNYSSKTIALLKRKGYLCSNIIVKLEHPFTNYVENMLTNNMTMLILQVTQNCNFRCRYCTYAYNSKIGRTHSTKTMSWEIAKKSIEYLSLHSSNTSDVSIAFYGGEPLLNFDLIKKSVKYAKNIMADKKITFSMTTNLYILTDDMIDFFIKNKFDLLVSLDGSEDIQNKHRRLSADGGDTYKVVFQNITNLKMKNEKYFYSHIRFNPVVYFDENPLTVLQYYKNILKVDSSSISIKQIDSTGLSIAFDPIDIKENEQSSEVLSKKDFEYYESVLINKNAITSNYHVNGSCVPGADKLFVTVNGEFFPCEKVNECNKNMQIGSIESGFNVDRIKHLMNIGSINFNKCKSCWAIRFCRVCCAQCDDGESNPASTVLDARCTETRKNILNFFKKRIDNMSYSTK